ncbi:zinc dependent phospholipase C family protein [Anaerocolumna xylanovorans]|uniref:Zinc dependent phospholipase C n=1 Tax=Anaerocolumna xylanovorans DSM 12503 TaxID=1121345 RepID=A0A1M7Y6F1_9FIRM|nr:zinc dependent phospholipase C family protein [Anaerocolumna xylanovorans]SHO48235.1 Zinc dependent phospholipase C [Anaerocolumna xylanovorans DSM 12503]
MYFFTHLFISKVLYRHFLPEVELDRRSFSYGNIKPDLPSRSRNHHTLENCLFTVCDYSKELMEEEVTLEYLSARLGEICHYVCDFFCYYHLNEQIHNRRLHHFFYEVGLHYKLRSIWHKHKIQITSSMLEPRKDISSIILEMRKSYFSQTPCMKRDIDYALMTSVWACESILYFMKYPSGLTGGLKPAICSLLTAEGELL